MRISPVRCIAAPPSERRPVEATALTLTRSLARAFAVVLFLAMLAIAVAARAEAPAQAGVELATSLLVIETDRGPVDFDVEVAVTPQQHAQGLQGRRTLAADAGMLFDFGPSSSVAMWMKDTYIPLDMLFIGNDRRITAIAANTKPLSLDEISPSGPVRAVLEVNAGTAVSFGIRVGDRVDHPIFQGR